MTVKVNMSVNRDIEHFHPFFLKYPLFKKKNTSSMNVC